jgi:hypothetical protein
MFEKSRTPVFAMAESISLDGGSRLDHRNRASLALAPVSEQRLVAYSMPPIPDVGHCLNGYAQARRAGSRGPQNINHIDGFQLAIDAHCQALMRELDHVEHAILSPVMGSILHEVETRRDCGDPAEDGCKIRHGAIGDRVWVASGEPSAPHAARSARPACH